MVSTYYGLVSRRFSDFLMASSFFYLKNSSRSVLEKNRRLCTQLAASMCKIWFHMALSSIVPAHFPNQIKKGPSVEYSEAWPRMWTFTHLLSACLLSCNRVAACRMQIVAAWPPVACKFRPILFMFHATGGHAGIIFMRLTATLVQFIFI